MSRPMEREEDLADVFRALSDAHRRTLLDRLRERDGQTLGELETALPQMTRFGVMKHLRILEEAGLLTTAREGRSKRHFLNPVPIRLIHDRWISRFAEPWVGGLADLKHSLEHPMSTLQHVFEVYIRATPEEVWRAITDPAMTERYYHGTAVESTWQPGAAINYFSDGESALRGEVVESDPPRRLVHSFEFPGNNDPTSRVTWEITPMGDSCLVRLTHDGFASETETYRSVASGWPFILSGMKTLLETGEELRVGRAEAVAG
jgi:uncharacterized protein YndB with AHSA1/START domain/DNA-binding transcriptional ArsR family regulator